MKQEQQLRFYKSEPFLTGLIVVIIAVSFVALWVLIGIQIAGNIG